MLHRTIILYIEILHFHPGFAEAYELDGGYRVEHHAPLLNKDTHGFVCHNFILPTTSTSHALNNDEGNDAVVVWQGEMGDLTLTVRAFEVLESCQIQYTSYSTILF